MSDVLTRLQAANPDLDIRDVSVPEFQRYGRLLTAFDASEMIARALAIMPDTERVAYEPSVAKLEEPSVFNRAVSREVFGGMPVEVGWCYGHNLSMGALEYHKGIEINVCLTDVILLMGDARDIDFGKEICYDTSKVEAFFAPKGSVVEFHTWNLHFAPIHTEKDGAFGTLVYLPKGTNEPLPFALAKKGESRLLTHVNKWLIAHPDSGVAAQGAYAGMVGDDITIVPA